MFKNIQRYFYFLPLKSLLYNNKKYYFKHGTSIYCQNQYPLIFPTRCLNKYGNERSFSSRSSYRTSTEDKSIAALRRHKLLFAIGLFSWTLLLVWLLKRRKLRKLNVLLEDCIRIPITENLFGSKVSLYRYHGCVFTGHIIMSGVLQELPNFIFREDDVVVASFPETGTTWIQEIVYMLTHDCTKSDETLEKRFPHLEHPYPGLEELSKREDGRLINTHLPSNLLPENFAASGAKLIYIVRNPRDTAVAYWNFLKLLPDVNFTGSFTEFLKLFTSNQIPYGPFPDHIKSYLNMETQNVLVICYEDLKETPVQVITNVAGFLQVPLKDEDALKLAAETSFNTMSQNSGNCWEEIGFADKREKIMNGEVGDWRNYFNEDSLNTFQEWENRNALKKSYKFKYNIKTK